MVMIDLMMRLRLFLSSFLFFPLPETAIFFISFACSQCHTVYCPPASVGGVSRRDRPFLTGTREKDVAWIDFASEMADGVPRDVLPYM